MAGKIIQRPELAGGATVNGVEVISAAGEINAPVSPGDLTLANTKILIGGATGVAAAQTMGGEATISNTGSVTLSTTGVTGKALTGFVSAPGVVAAADTILQALNKTDGNVVALQALAVGGALADGNIIVGNGAGVAASVNPSGDVDVSNAGAFSIGNNKVVTAMILDGNVTQAKVANTTGISELGVLKIANVLYDFAVDGGVAGTIVLTGAPTIPDNAVVTAFNWDVLTTCTSATDAATIAIQLPTDGVLTTAVAISAVTNIWDAGPHSAFDTGSLVKKTSAARIPSLLVAGGENLTAGKILFHLQYYISA
jgi:hypothetical protein